MALKWSASCHYENICLSGLLSPLSLFLFHTSLLLAWDYALYSYSETIKIKFGVTFQFQQRKFLSKSNLAFTSPKQ